MPAERTVKIRQTETEIAILQVQVSNIEDKVGEIKVDLKEVSSTSNKNAENTHKILKEMKEDSAAAHKSMSEKIGSLEKWRWMMMGAGIVIGSLGFETVAKLLK